MFNLEGQPSAPDFSFPWKRNLLVTMLAFVAAFVVMSLIGVVCAVLQPQLSNLMSDPMLFGSIFQFASYVVTFAGTILFLRAWLPRDRGFGEMVSGGFSLLRTQFARALGAGAIGYLVSVISVLLIYTLLPLPSPQSPAGDFGKTLTGASFIWFALTAVVAAPILEELLFRGLMQNMLRGAFRVSFIGRRSLIGADVVALVITSALFALAHGTLTGFPPLFITGLLLGEVYRRTNNLWAPMAMHALNNAVAVALLYVSIST